MAFNKKQLDEAMDSLDDWGSANPETNSLIAGASAVAGGIVALNIAPSLFIMGSVFHTLYSIGVSTSDKTLNRWTKMNLNKTGETA